MAGHVLDVGTPRQQAALAVDAGRPVAIEALIDRIWDDSPPVEARNVLYSHLSRIRQLLERTADLTGEPVVRIERRHAGYLLGVDPDLVDPHRFRRLVEHGCGAQCGDVARVTVLAEALELWRGPPMAAVSGRWAEQVRSSWHRRRLDGVMRWAQAVLQVDNPTAVITVLHDFVAEYPLVEPLEGLLMRALHAAGRGAEAIERYTVVRQRLADNLGADPAPNSAPCTRRSRVASSYRHRPTRRSRPAGRWPHPCGPRRTCTVSPEMTTNHAIWRASLTRSSRRTSTL